MLPERRTAARTGLAALQLAPILVSVVWQASWVGLLLHSSDPLGRLRHLDWYAFFQAGHRLLAGDLQALYPRELREEFLWLYPPYCAYVTAPLGLLSEQWAYIVCCAVQVASVAGASWAGSPSGSASCCSARCRSASNAGTISPAPPTPTSTSSSS